MAYMDVAGLYQKYGLEQTQVGAGGEYKTYGEFREIEFLIPDLTKLTASDAVILGGDNIFFPIGFKIEQVEIITDTAATSGGSATLILGLMKTDRTTMVDATGVVNAVAVATLTAGSKQTYVKGTSGAGTQVGTGAQASAFPAYITAKFGTAAFTAGAVRIRIKYYK